MDVRIIDRGRAGVDPDNLSERIARFATAINGCSAQHVSKSDRKAANRVMAREGGTKPNEAEPESAADSARWHSMPGLIGQHAPAPDARHGFRAG